MTAPDINSVVLRETIAGYTQAYTVFSSTVEPLPGQQFINIGEECMIRLTATNDPYFGTAGGVGLVNVRWHVMSVNTALSIVVPPLPLEAREGPTADMPLLTAGDHVPELYLFPRYGKKLLEQGETDVIEIRGHADSAGVIQILFNLVADVDAGGLDLLDQTSSALGNQPSAQVEPT